MALNVTSCFRRKNGHDGTTTTVEFYSPRVVRRERERKRNTFKKLHFSFFFVFFLLLINVSKVVALFIVVHFFEDIGNFIDFCFDALRSKDCFLLEFDYKCTVRKKKENFYIILQKKKKKKYLRNFERLHQEENGA